MDYSSVKKWPNETPASSAIVNDAPIYCAQQDTKRIPHYFFFSIFSVLCLCPATGLIALAYSIKSSAKADVKFLDKARLYSRRALFWNVLSIVFAVLSTIVFMMYFYQLSQLIKMHGNHLNEHKQINDINKMIQSMTNN